MTRSNSERTYWTMFEAMQSASPDEDPLWELHDFAFDTYNAITGVLERGNRQQYHLPQRDILASNFVLYDMKRLFDEYEDVLCTVDPDQKVLDVIKPSTGGRIVVYLAHLPNAERC